MRLIALLAALCAEHFLDIRKPKDSYHWLQTYEQKIRSMFENTFIWRTWWGALLITLLPISILILLVFCFFSNWLFGLVGLVLDFIVLWYCLGPGDLQDELKQYQSLEHDSTAAISCAETIIDDPNVDINQTDRDREITKAIFWQAHERTFAVLFWFVILGGFGTALYRITWYFKREGHFQAWHNIFAWIPSRLVAITYLLTGNFHPGYSRWKASLSQIDQDQSVVMQCGADALGVDLTIPRTEDAKMEQQQALSLVMRSLLLWVALISVITILAIIA
jgi:AmpE protein